MISFIIIGRNEGWKLTQCIESVYVAIKENEILNYEIIYVDSNSDDDSLDRCKTYKEIKVYKLINLFNAAIARNLGAMNSKGDVLVFLDGDMTINPDFIKKVIVENKLIHPLVGGIVIDRIIDMQRIVIKELYYHKSDKEYYKLITGGAFIIERQFWNLVGGMDNRFIRGEDPELGIRLAKRGVLLLNLPAIFVVHHNDKYKEGIRLSIKGINKSILFSSMLIYRKNLFNKYAWKRIFTHEKSLIALFISILVSLILGNFFYILFYIIVLLLRSINSLSLFMFFERFIYYLARDLIVFFGFLFYYPKFIKNEELKYSVIEN